MINNPLQAAFASDFTQMWNDKSLGLKRAKGTGKLTILIANSFKGLELVLQSAIPSLYPVRVIYSLQTWLHAMH